MGSVAAGRTKRGASDAGLLRSRAFDFRQWRERTSGNAEALISRHGIFLLVGVLGVTGFGVTPASGQSHSADPLSAAIAWVLDRDGLGGYGHRLVVDTVHGTQGIGRTAARLPPHAAQGRATVAVSLGARVGTLAAELRCPDVAPVPPPPRQSRQGCRLVGARAVMQVDEPDITGDSAVVVIVTWGFQEDPAKQAWYVVSIRRELMVARAADGSWIVTGQGLMSIGHW